MAPPPVPLAARRIAQPVAALDYKDPTVAKEFSNIQVLDTEEVEDELMASGIPVPPTMNVMDMRMMLVEVRMRKAGKMPGDKKEAPKKAPSGASDFEKALYEKPAFKALYNDWQATRNTNAMNLATEYLINPRRAKERYGGTAKYDETVATIEDALNAKIELVVTSGKIAFSGFPANMGEAGMKMTLETFGPLVTFEYSPNDDGMTAGGQAEYEEMSAAKACVEKYDGMDMGLGTKLSFEAL
jgi:hypothetical protein